MELPIYEFEMSVCSWHWEWRQWVSNSLPMRSKYIAPMITSVPVCCAHGIYIIPLNSNWLSAGQLLIEMSKGWAGESWLLCSYLPHWPLDDEAHIQLMLWRDKSHVCDVSKRRFWDFHWPTTGQWQICGWAQFSDNSTIQWWALVFK